MRKIETNVDNKTATTKRSDYNETKKKKKKKKKKRAAAVFLLLSICCFPGGANPAGGTAHFQSTATVNRPQRCVGALDQMSPLTAPQFNGIEGAMPLWLACSVSLSFSLFSEFYYYYYYCYYYYHYHHH